MDMRVFRNSAESLPPRDLVTMLALGIEPPPLPLFRRLFEGGSATEALRRLRASGWAPGARAVRRAEFWVRDARDAGRRLLIWGAAGYPPRLAEIGSPPVALDVAGPADLGAPSVAIVGSRRATDSGLGTARAFGAGLAGAGLAVVSGLARGIDAAAHRGALDADGVTLAVLGAGHDRLYPPEHAPLARRIAARGAVITEFPPGTVPLPRHFPRRNRIVAGLTLGALVVEAAERSGSLSTARQAADNDREVFAIPGPLGSEASRGCHALIRSGACLVTSVDDVLEELPPLD